MDQQNVEIVDGKRLLNIALGANRWEIERHGVEFDPEESEACFNRLNSTVTYLVRNWTRIHGSDKAMAEAGLSRDIGELIRYGYTLVAILTFGRPTADGGERRYNAVVRVLRNE